MNIEQAIDDVRHMYSRLQNGDQHLYDFPAIVNELDQLRKELAEAKAVVEKPPRKKTIVEIVQERGGTIDPNYQSPEAFLRTCGPFQGDVDGDDAEAKKGTQT